MTDIDKMVQAYGWMIEDGTKKCQRDYMRLLAMFYAGHTRQENADLRTALAKAAKEWESKGYKMQKVTPIRTLIN